MSRSRTQTPRTALRTPSLMPVVLCLLLAATAESGAIHTENPEGNQSVVTALGSISSQQGVWRPVPGLSTGVLSGQGDSLEIAVSAEMLGPTAVWLMATVDGRLSAPSAVLFKDAGGYDGTRSFTFVKPAMSAGQHVVEILWYTAPGPVSQMGDRSLTVQSVSPVGVIGSLATATGTAIVSNSSPAWQDVPGLTASLTTDRTGVLAVTFSADSVADSGRLIARALVDGVGTADVVLAEAGAGRGARAYTFVRTGLPAGSHDVRIQWRAESGSCRVYARSLSAFFTRGVTERGGMEAAGLQPATAYITSGTTWVDVPSISTSFPTYTLSTSAALTLGAEVRYHPLSWLSIPLEMRVLVDGRVVSPATATFAKGDSDAWRAVSYAFTVKNLRPGTHSVRLQARGQAWRIGDRFWRIVHKERSGSEFAQPFTGMAPKFKTFRTLAICFDPVRPDHAPPSMAQLRHMHEGDDGGLSMNGWFAENSGAHVSVGAPGSVRYVGCEDGNWFRAPMEHQGEWYWKNEKFELMWQEAIKAADPEVDFHSYDENSDGRITPDELIVEVVRPQNGPYGTYRHTNVAVDGIGTPMYFDVVDAYLSAIDANRRWSVGLIAHEFSHAALGAWDLHSCPSETTPGLYSIMDWHGEATHLDPLHKIKSGFVLPELMEVSHFGPGVTETVALAPVETSRKVMLLYDPARGDREYFVLENRFGSNPFGDNYDEPLEDGVVVWHLFEDAGLAQQYPPPGGESCGGDRNSVRRLEVLDVAGESRILRWADGTPVGLFVRVEPGTPDAPDATVVVGSLN